LSSQEDNQEVENTYFLGIQNWQFGHGSPLASKDTFCFNFAAFLVGAFGGRSFFMGSTAAILARCEMYRSYVKSLK
jgi:hypothetical protein